MADEREQKSEPAKAQPVRKPEPDKATDQKLKDTPPSELSEGDGTPGLTISGGGGHA